MLTFQLSITEDIADVESLLRTPLQPPMPKDPLVRESLRCDLLCVESAPQCMRYALETLDAV